MASSTAESGETLEPKAAVKAPLVVPPERKRPSPATANVTPTGGEAKRSSISEPKPKAAAESAPMTAKERRNGQTTPRPEPELSEREYRIQAIARMVAEEQKELHQKFDAAYVKVRELKAAEPKGLLCDPRKREKKAPALIGPAPSQATGAQRGAAVGRPSASSLPGDRWSAVLFKSQR